MRIVFAILSAAIILGMTWLYQQTLAENEPSELPGEVAEVVETYRLRIVATFDAGVDPFAEDVSKATSLKVSLQGEEIVTVDRPIAAGEPVDVELELTTRSGTNEFLVEMSPANVADTTPRAVHVELFRGDMQQPLQSETIWAAGTESQIVGRVQFEVEAPAGEEVSE